MTSYLALGHMITIILLFFFFFCKSFNHYIEVTIALKYVLCQNITEKLTTSVNYWVSRTMEYLPVVYWRLPADHNSSEVQAYSSAQNSTTANHHHGRFDTLHLSASTPASKQTWLELFPIKFLVIIYIGGSLTTPFHDFLIATVNYWVRVTKRALYSPNLYCLLQV